ncbi:DUF1338 domain-containing protein [Edaphobacter sp. 4G125]|nr:DUF1338 domain-containing protein [Edaphobacter sp. 4G125]
MQPVHGGTLQTILDRSIGSERTARLFQVLVIDLALMEDSAQRASRAILAQALNMLLFEDLLERVPAAKTYVEHCLSHGKTVMHDHGAVRTIAMSGMGDLPAGEESIARILRPLGYALNGVYPLERLRMTGRSYAQVDFPEEIAQFFISELHPERFSAEFQAALKHIVTTSTNPLTPEAKGLLEELESSHSLNVDQAVVLLPVLVSCFGRQHKEVTLADYEILLAESAEAAWISTEGNAFNHATDRVEDVDQLASEQKALGQPMKAVVETSQSGRVRQTAFRAAQVSRTFRMSDGSPLEKEVPGSFLEFITRLPLPEEGAGKRRLDLSFDSSNAQAIFKMTSAAKS